MKKLTVVMVVILVLATVSVALANGVPGYWFPPGGGGWYGWEIYGNYSLFW